MPEFLVDRSLGVSADPESHDLLRQITSQVVGDLRSGEMPVRFAVTDSFNQPLQCEVGVHCGGGFQRSIFEFQPRSIEDTSSFNVAMIIPTGIGAEIGGHAGDGAPAATLLASVCDSLITHPNVFNASDMIQIPNNTYYVEGSALTRLMMGTIKLHHPRANRVLALIQSHEDRLFSDAAINAVNAARAYYALNISDIAMLGADFRMVSEFKPFGVRFRVC